MRACEACGELFEPARPHAKCCSDTCRKRKQRMTVSRDAEAAPGRTQAAVMAELEAAGRVETVLGAAALALAERIDSSTAVMGFAPLVKELRSTMEAALEGSQTRVTKLTELRAARDAKRGA